VPVASELDGGSFQWAGPVSCFGSTPVVGWLDLGVHPGMLLEQVQQIRAGQQLKRLVVGKVK